MLLEEGVYQEIRMAVAKSSPKWPDFLAIESDFGSVALEKRVV
jgi:hypothetical protein